MKDRSENVGDERLEGRRAGRKAGRKEGFLEGRKEGRKAGRKQQHQRSGTGKCVESRWRSNGENGSPPMKRPLVGGHGAFEGDGVHTPRHSPWLSCMWPGGT